MLIFCLLSNSSSPAKARQVLAIDGAGAAWLSAPESSLANSVEDHSSNCLNSNHRTSVVADALSNSAKVVRKTDPLVLHAVIKTRCF